jgi:hypothetical protein
MEMAEIRIAASSCVIPLPALPVQSFTDVLSAAYLTMEPGVNGCFVTPAMVTHHRHHPNYGFRDYGFRA